MGNKRKTKRSLFGYRSTNPNPNRRQQPSTSTASLLSTPPDESVSLQSLQSLGSELRDQFSNLVEVTPRKNDVENDDEQDMNLDLHEQSNNSHNSLSYLQVVGADDDVQGGEKETELDYDDEQDIDIDQCKDYEYLEDFFSFPEIQGNNFDNDNEADTEITYEDYENFNAEVNTTEEKESINKDFLIIIDEKKYLAAMKAVKHVQGICRVATNFSVKNFP